MRDRNGKDIINGNAINYLALFIKPTLALLQCLYFSVA